MSESSVPRVVLGNESCDLDSAVSAFVYAAYLSIATGMKHIPVFNIPFADYKLHTEVHYIFNRFNIHREELTFKDDINLTSDCGKLMLTLVDHNVLGAADKHLHDHVVHVLDHHKVECNYSPSVTMRIEPVGSCCSLVADEILKSTVTLPTFMYTMLLGGILIDTSNLSKEVDRARPLDEQMVSKLKSLQSEEIAGLYAELAAAKMDVSGLNTEELIRKDMKMVEEEKSRIMMSSLPVPIDAFLDRDDAKSKIADLASNRQLDAMLLMSLVIDQNRVCRQLAITGPNQSLVQKIADGLCQQNEVDLKLQLIPQEGRFIHKSFMFNQGNIKASRKIILPAVRSILREISDN